MLSVLIFSKSFFNRTVTFVSCERFNIVTYRFEFNIKTCSVLFWYVLFKSANYMLMYIVDMVLLSSVYSSGHALERMTLFEVEI